MSRQEYRAFSRHGACYIGLLLVGMLSGCEQFWNKPEDRAQAFIETFIAAPNETDKLRNIAVLPPERNPEELLEGLAARVALDFLRAKQAQGMPLSFTCGEVRRADASHRVVSIRVSDASTVVAINKDVAFQVYMEKNDQNQWRIARVTH